MLGRANWFGLSLGGCGWAFFGAAPDDAGVGPVTCKESPFASYPSAMPSKPSQERLTVWASRHLSPNLHLPVDAKKRHIGFAGADFGLDDSAGASGPTSSASESEDESVSESELDEADDEASESSSPESSAAFLGLTESFALAIVTGACPVSAASVVSIASAVLPPHPASRPLPLPRCTSIPLPLPLPLPLPRSLIIGSGSGLPQSSACAAGAARRPRPALPPRLASGFSPRAIASCRSCSCPSDSSRSRYKPGEQQP